MALRKPIFMSTEGYSEEMQPSDSIQLGALDMSGNITMNGNLIQTLGTPVAGTDAANKDYVDAVATGLNIKQSVRLGTAAALPAYTPAGSGVGKTLTANANGALTVDGVAVATNNRILVKDEGGGTDSNNGIYVVTQPGSVGTPYILTRAVDFDQNAEVMAGSFTFVTEGTANADTGWVLITDDPITVDTTALTFSQFSSATTVTYDAGLIKVGASVSVEVDTGANAQGAGSGGGSSGLEFDVAGAAGKLRAAVNATAGIERTVSGLGVKLNGTTLASGASGLSVDHAPKVEETAVTAENLAAGDPVAWYTTANQVYKSQANNDARARVIGVNLAAVLAAATASFVANGVAAGVLVGATPGDPYYLASTGGLSTSAPGSSNRVIQVGIAKNATDLWVRIVDYGKKALACLCTLVDFVKTRY